MAARSALEEAVRFRDDLQAELWSKEEVTDAEEELLELNPRAQRERGFLTITADFDRTRVEELVVTHTQSRQISLDEGPAGTLQKKRLGGLVEQLWAGTPRRDRHPWSFALLPHGKSLPVGSKRNATRALRVLSGRQEALRLSRQLLPSYVT
eukprot:1707998-Rhodomonas_salina.1